MADKRTEPDVIDEVISVIVRHAVSEEMYVYPAMREHLPDGERAVEHDTREHKQLEKVMVGPGVGPVDRLRDKPAGRPRG